MTLGDGGSLPDDRLPLIYIRNGMINLVSVEDEAPPTAELGDLAVVFREAPVMPDQPADETPVRADG